MDIFLNNLEKCISQQVYEAGHYFVETKVREGEAYK